MRNQLLNCPLFSQPASALGKRRTRQSGFVNPLSHTRGWLIFQRLALENPVNRGKTSNEIIRCFLIAAAFAEPILSLPPGAFRE
jgi:hypothetical protein